MCSTPCFFLPITDYALRVTAFQLLEQFPCSILFRFLLAFTASFCFLILPDIDKDSKTTPGFPGELISW